jgi:Putative auto-transporter adhesin, head GIN domain
MVNNHEASFSVEKNSALTGDCDISILKMRVSDNSRVELMGDCGELNLLITQNSKAFLFNLKTNEATVQARENSKAEIYSENDSKVMSDENSSVIVNGKKGG